MCVGRVEEGGTTNGPWAPTGTSPSAPVPLHLKIGAIALVAMAAFGIALFGGYIPGLRPNYSEPATIEVRGLPYYWTEYHLSWPVPPATTTTPSVVTFHNITFALWLTNWYSGPGGIVNGNGTEPNGTVYAFNLTLASLGANSTSPFFSPDREFGAAWSGQVFVELLVRATPPAGASS
jgi:hypothetical protein